MEEVVAIETKTCVTCGDLLHPERAERYDYCTKPECRRRNARGVRIAAVGVNKAAEQFVVLNDRTAREAASGRYKKQPDAAGSPQPRPRIREAVRKASVARASARSAARPWTDAQENLARTYREMGLAPDAIARKLGVSQRLVVQMLLAAPRPER